MDYRHGEVLWSGQEKKGSKVAAGVFALRAEGEKKAIFGEKLESWVKEEGRGTRGKEFGECLRVILRAHKHTHTHRGVLLPVNVYLRLQDEWTF